MVARFYDESSYMIFIIRISNPDNIQIYTMIYSANISKRFLRRVTLCNLFILLWLQSLPDFKESYLHDLEDINYLGNILTGKYYFNLKMLLTLLHEYRIINYFVLKQLMSITTQSNLFLAFGRTVITLD